MANQSGRLPAGRVAIGSKYNAKGARVLDVQRQQFALGATEDEVFGVGGSETQYTDGQVVSGPTGTVILWKSVGDALVAVSAVNPLPVSALIGQPVMVGAQYALAVSIDSANPTLLTIPTGATKARITNDPEVTTPGSIRWVYTGLPGSHAPDATHGNVMQSGDTFDFDNLPIIGFWAATTGLLMQVAYYHD